MRYLALYAEGDTATSNYNGTSFVISEIQGYEAESATGTDRFAGKTCYASLEFGVYVAGQAVDGLTSKYWISHISDTEPYQWWVVDMGAEYDIRFLNWHTDDLQTPSQVGVFVTNNYITPPSVANGWQRVATLNPAMTTEWQGFIISLPTVGATVPIIDGWNQTGALIR